MPITPYVLHCDDSTPMAAKRHWIGWSGAFYGIVFKFLGEGKQGDPLSPLVFTVLPEPPVATVRAGIGTEEHKMCLYAGDNLLLINDPILSIPNSPSTNSYFSKISGYKINWQKI